MKSIRTKGIAAMPLALLLAGGLAASCAEDRTCDAPPGCLRAGRAGGSCQCTEWSTVRVEPVPVKFVVLSVVYRLPGSASQVWYGHGGPLEAHSQVGARWRSVVRAQDGTERPAALGVVDVGQGAFFAEAVTATSLAASGGTGDADGWSFPFDIPATSEDLILVWLNPAAVVTTDFAGNRRIDWSWSAYCPWPPELGCGGGLTLPFTLGQLDGTRPAVDPYTRAFLETLTDQERAEIRGYHPLQDPRRDPRSLAADPRFQHLGRASVAAGAASWPTPRWQPCPVTLSDEQFPVYAETEIGLPGEPARLLVQHSVQADSATCAPQEPGLQLATSTAGCALQADLYVDRAFGTILPIVTSASAECTRP